MHSFISSRMIHVLVRRFLPSLERSKDERRQEGRLGLVAEKYFVNFNLICA
jgi:hypothetical protein